MYSKWDFLIIGSGIAGLSSALTIARSGKKVALITKKELKDGSTLFAQGGIAAVDPKRDKNKEDSYKLHIEDSLAAADDLGSERITKLFVEHAYEEVIDFLIHEGVPFSKKEDGSFVLHQEGGHAKPRIYCVADHTGKEVEEVLIEKIKQENNIEIFEYHNAIDIITSKKLHLKGANRCLGVYVYDIKNQQVKVMESAATILATGGAGRIFLYTTNNPVSTGDGIAMAFRAGAEIANLEFTQFHPTVLYGYDSNGRSFLLTEALRGKAQGGILTLSNTGKESTIDFVKDLGYSTDGSAGTRDIVARAIDTEMKKRGLNHVYLNVTTKQTGKEPDQIRNGYPQINRQLTELGINMTTDPIPVVPASHYTCGGIVTDENGCVPEIAGLYAIGECSCTGLMGANRLASNSLSEGALFGKIAARHALSQKPSTSTYSLSQWDPGKAVQSDNQALIEYYWDEIRRMMWYLVGIVRDKERLTMAQDRIAMIKKEINKYYWEYIINSDFLELRNIADVAELTIRAALKRKESRGSHYRIDYPKKDGKITKMRHSSPSLL